MQIGPGTYNEVVVCKPWVFLSGAGVGHTTITAPASTEQWNKGTVKAASHSAVQDMTILSTGTTWGNWATAVDCTGAVNFDIENCNLEANGQNGVNMVTLAVDYNATGGGSQVNVAYTMVGAHGGTTGNVSGMLVYARAYVHVMLTDSSAHITATDCKLLGPYSPGVVVNPS